jgi:hypothetical protein
MKELIGSIGFSYKKCHTKEPMIYKGGVGGEGMMNHVLNDISTFSSKGKMGELHLGLYGGIINATTNLKRRKVPKNVQCFFAFSPPPPPKAVRGEHNVLNQ